MGCGDRSSDYALAEGSEKVKTIRSGNQRVTVSLSKEDIGKVANLLSDAAVDSAKKGKVADCAMFHFAAAAYFTAYNRESR